MFVVSRRNSPSASETERFTDRESQISCCPTECTPTAAAVYGVSPKSPAFQSNTPGEEGIPASVPRASQETFRSDNGSKFISPELAVTGERQKWEAFALAIGSLRGFLRSCSGIYHAKTPLVGIATRSSVDSMMTQALC